MRKHLFFIIAVFTTVVICRGQSISPEVMATAGSSGTAGSTEINWTIGEPMVETLIGANSILSQGFHQPSYVIVTAEKPIFSQFEVNVFPNPVRNEVFAKISRGNNDPLEIQLTDVIGNILDSKISQVSEETIVFDMSHTAIGTYFIRVINKSGDSYKAFRIIKSN